MVENNLTYGDLVYIRSLLDTSRQLGILLLIKIYWIVWKLWRFASFALKKNRG